MLDNFHATSLFVRQSFRYYFQFFFCPISFIVRYNIVHIVQYSLVIHTLFWFKKSQKERKYG